MPRPGHFRGPSLLWQHHQGGGHHRGRMWLRRWAICFRLRSGNGEARACGARSAGVLPDCGAWRACGLATQPQIRLRPQPGRRSFNKRQSERSDAGRYNGLAETQNEAIHYPIRTPGRTGPAEPAVLAGPPCDSTHILYERTPVLLPSDLQIGDPVDFLTAGAYTASYASEAFNGFPPIQTICACAHRPDPGRRRSGFS